MSQGDTKTFLSLQHIIWTRVEHHVYLEIGSHLGVTLVPQHTTGEHHVVPTAGRQRVSPKVAAVTEYAA
jgi:hypothetical protein